MEKPDKDRRQAKKKPGKVELQSRKHSRHIPCLGERRGKEKKRLGSPVGLYCPQFLNTDAEWKYD